MTTPEIPAAKKKLKVWQIIVLVLIGLAIIGSFVPDETSDTLTSDSGQTSSSGAQTYDDSWIPAGFTSYPEDANVAWRWGTNSETNCSYSSGSCWSVMVVTQDGCPSGIYAELAILDASKVQIDYTNDSTSRVLPGTKVKLTFDTFNEDAETARVSEISCR